MFNLEFRFFYGLMRFHIFKSGLVLDPNANDPDTLALKNLNEFVKNDDRVDISMLRTGDGTTLCRVR